MPLFQKKPLVIDAWQFKGLTGVPGVYWDGEGRPYVVTLHEQRCYVVPGDWVVAEDDGIHHYPVKADVFAARYEPVPGPAPEPIPGHAPPPGSDA